VDVDISGDCTDTAIAGIFCTVVTTSTSRTIGLRTNGSSFAVTSGAAVYRSSAGFHIVPVDGSELCEQYIDNAEVDLYLVGYIKSDWTFVDYTDYSISTTGAYTDMTALPSGALGGLFLIDGSFGGLSHIRKNGSSADLYNYRIYNQTLVEGDGSRVCEGEINNTGQDFYLVGYPTAPAPPGGGGGNAGFGSMTGGLQNPFAQDMTGGLR
jgi:hypothetical protein